LIRLSVIAPETREMSRNSKRISRAFDLTAVQGHPWCQWKAHVRLHISH